MIKIICPVDFSQASLNAIEYAARIGEKHLAELILLHVFTEKEFNLLLDSEAIEASVQERMQTIEHELQALSEEVNRTSRRNGLYNCRYLIIPGDFLEMTVQLQEQEGAELIVMGTTGVKDVAEDFWGTHTLQMIERTNCPVLCVPQEAGYRSLRNVVYGSKYDEGDDQGVKTMIDLFKPFPARFHLVHISRHDSESSQMSFDHFAFRLIQLHPEIELQQHRILSKDRLEKEFDRFMQENNAQLLVLVTRKHGFLEKIWQDNFTRLMSHYAEYAILFVKYQS